jgi:hypothetical protein
MFDFGLLNVHDFPFRGNVCDFKLSETSTAYNGKLSGFSLDENGANGLALLVILECGPNNIGPIFAVEQNCSAWFSILCCNKNILKSHIFIIIFVGFTFTKVQNIFETIIKIF